MILVPLPRWVFPTCPPFFLAGENVPSANPFFQSILPSLLRLRIKRFHVLFKVSLSVHWTKRRQQVVDEGNQEGMSPMDPTAK